MPLFESREKALFFLTIGLTVGAIGASALTNLSTYISIFENDKILFLLCGLLMLTTLSFFIGWFKFDSEEISIISDYIIEENRLKRGQFMMIVAPVSLGLLFVILISLVTNIIAYTVIILLVFIMGGLGDTYVQSLLSQVLITNKKEDTILQDQKWGKLDRQSILNIRNAVAEYYLENRYFFRLIITISFLFISLIFSLHYLSINNVISSYLGYIFTIMAILFNETVIWNWRIKRNKLIFKEIIEIESRQKTNKNVKK